MGCPVRAASAAACIVACALITGEAGGGRLPPPVPARRAELTLSEAGHVVAAVLGCVPGKVEETRNSYVFQVTGMVRGRRCPMEGTRGTSCGEFRWMPSRVELYKSAMTAPVSAHLAANRLVVVDMRSDSAGLSMGTLHGVLVFPKADVLTRERPAFAWYLDRLGTSLDLSVTDVDSDGADDIVYTYALTLAGGVRVVARDVWSVAGLKPGKLVSSGERLSGVFLSSFDGMPLHDDGMFSLGRGTWRFPSVSRKWVSCFMACWIS